MAAERLNNVDELGPAFFGLQLYHLLQIINEQGNDLMSKRGLVAPARTASTLMLLKINGPTSVTGIGKFLNMSHQLVAHRIRDLSDSGLVSSKPDSADRRRTLIRLTAKGHKQVNRLVELCSDAVLAYEDLFDEIGTNLFDAILKAKKSMLRFPLAERIDKLR